jgi:hypothetical protein
MTGRFEHFDALPADPTDWSWRTRTRRARGKSAVDSDVVPPRWIISPLPLNAECRLPRSHGARGYGDHPC